MSMFGMSREKSTVRSGYFVGDAMDDFLTSLMLVRKAVARDENSLFRAVSEQIYKTQKFHGEIRQLCLQYIKRNSAKFDNLTLTEKHIRALSFLYKRDFLIYQEINKPPVQVTNGGYSSKIVLCGSFGNHFDNVFTRRFQQKAAICQSLTYDMVYKGVFHMDTDVEAAVGLLRSQNSNFNNRMRAASAGDAVAPSSPTMNTSVMPIIVPIAPNYSPCSVTGRSFPPFPGVPFVQPRQPIDKPTNELHSVNELSSSMDADMRVRIRQSQMAITGPPFPYKVVKALDPVTYRNTEYDVWVDECKAQYGVIHRRLQSTPFPPGSPCWVRLNRDGKLFYGIVQQVPIESERGPVIVYIPELGEKRQVLTDQLEPLPQENQNQYNHYNRNRNPKFKLCSMSPDVFNGKGKTYNARSSTSTNFANVPPDALRSMADYVSKAWEEFTHDVNSSVYYHQ